ncbi:PAS domain-containing sensor histidine kinase [Clostridium sp. C8-1-8]|uniref:PAS domain-containing sensor histidine kinase n=1 Tax=Clostridium sp. C8-1-8 TaxID=2698831 RepID=UPI001367A2A1|nr:PAS domain-containing sensor histidine kinase [Clostridium sp. C8-1-8]
MNYCNSPNEFYGKPYVLVDNETVVEVSESFTLMTEYSVEELLNKNIKELFSVLRIGPNFNGENTEGDKEYFIFTKSFGVRFVSIDITGDSFQKVFVFSEDPNSRWDVKFSAIEALCSHKKFGVAVFSTPDITLLKANQTYLNFLDKPFNNMENSIGKRIYEIIPGWIGSSSEDIWKSVLADSKPFYSDEYMFKFERGLTYWEASLTPVFEDGVLKYCIEITSEITEKVLNRKKVEEQSKFIEQQKRELEVILDNMSDALFIINPDGSYRYINKRAYDMTYRSDKVQKHGDSINHTKYYYMNGKELIREELPGSKVLKGEKIDNIVLKAVRPDKTMYLGFTGSSLYDNDGKLTSAIICIRDMTDYIISTEALEKSQLSLLQVEREKNEALEKAMLMKDEFLSLISHEFKTPINVINMAIQTLNNIYEDQMTDKVKMYMGTIKQNTNRQLRLVNNLLDITRANEGRIKMHKSNLDIVFLTKVITESVYEFAAKKKIQMKFVSKLVKKVIAVDDEKYERILLNLLSNAIKFTPEGKSIVVSLYSLKGKVCVDVKDSGIGIPSDKLEVIFEKFGQVDSSLSRQAEGTGIGLSLVKKFIGVLGGSISVKSKVGEGTTFTIILPDEIVVEESNDKPMIDLMNDNRLTQAMNVEFSDIYL